MIDKKDMPTWIYLQRVPDAADSWDGHSEFENLGEMTWCVDKINDSDIRYVLDNSQLKGLDR